MIFKMPDDGWGSIKPRNWQATALPKIIEAYQKPDPLSYVVRAVTGSGKSKLMSQIAACCKLDPNESVVVSTSSIFLVEQLEDTFRERLNTGGFMSGPDAVGCYYMHGKNITAPVIITCTPSLPELAKRMESNGRKCGLWIADELHRTKCRTISDGYEILKPHATLGFGATPFRAKFSESLTLFDQLIVNYTADEAIKDGVVVPFRSVFWNGGEGTLDSICCQMVELARGPGLVNAVSIDDCEIFCMKLVESGMMAKTLHSKMPKAERQKRMEELRTGQLQCLIHCAILQEGADLPWLRWLCMRRPVTSRVRFLQEIGRVLRSWEDPVTGEKKEEAVLYDPHCLLSDFNMTYREVLGGEAPPEEEEDEPEGQKASEKKRKEIEQLIMEVMRELVNVRAGKKPLSMTPLSGYLVELVSAFDMCGLVDRKIANKEWRTRPASEKQATAAKALARVATMKCVPSIHRKPLQLLAETVGTWNTMGGFTPQLTRGLSADLLTVMMSLADKKRWPDLKILDRSADESMKAHEQRKKNLVERPITTPQIVLPHQKEAKKSQEQPLFNEM